LDTKKTKQLNNTTQGPNPYEKKGAKPITKNDKQPSKQDHRTIRLTPKQSIIDDIGINKNTETMPDKLVQSIVKVPLEPNIAKYKMINALLSCIKSAKQPNQVDAYALRRD
jgi:hypothetical protein